MPSRRAADRALLPIGAGAGQLQIVVHAMSRDGLLHDRDDDYKYQRDPLLTAQLIYQGNKKLPGATATDKTKEQYHAHWDGDSFLLWIRRALMPVFQKLYGEERALVLVLDNSGNHSRRPPGSYVSPSTATKSQIAEHLRAHGVHKLTADRGEVTVPATRAAPGRRGRPATAAVPAHVKRDVKVIDSDLWDDAGPIGPYKEELAIRLRQLYAERPELTESALERLFADGVSVLPAGLRPGLARLTRVLSPFLMTHCGADQTRRRPGTAEGLPTWSAQRCMDTPLRVRNQSYRTRVVAWQGTRARHVTRPQHSHNSPHCIDHRPHWRLRFCRGLHARVLSEADRPHALLPRPMGGRVQALD